MKIIDTILDILLPVHCLFCRTGGKPVCIKCLSECRLAERENMEWVFSVYDYRDPHIKKIIWLLKYKNRKNLSVVLAESVYDIMLPVLEEAYNIYNFRDPIVIPIPLSKKRLRERGYNQTELVVKDLIKIDRNQNFMPMYNVLVKKHETEHQARIKNKQERMQNLVDTFDIKDISKIKGRNIILIDDVTTTGATLTEAKKTLKKMGAVKVMAFTFAH